jgi:hypothetical protein
MRLYAGPAERKPDELYIRNVVFDDCNPVPTLSRRFGTISPQRER